MREMAYEETEELGNSDALLEFEFLLIYAENHIQTDLTLPNLTRANLL